MLPQSTLGLLVVLESIGLVLTIGMFGIAIVVMRRANRHLNYARQKAEDARLGLKGLLTQLSDSL